MKKHALGRWRAAAGASVVAGLAIALASTTPAVADPIGAGRASAFGATITVGGEEVVPPTPQVEVTTVPADAQDTTVNIPAEPLAVSGTLNAFASLHAQSDLESALESEGVTHSVEGPYNARGEGLIEGADVLLDAVAEDVSLVSADVIRAEAVAVCTAEGTVAYSANSEIVNLQIGGEEVPVNDPLQQIIDGLNDALEQSGLNAVVDIERNVVTEIEGGIAIDGLVVTVLSAAGEDPLGQVRLAHAEVSGVTCGAAPACSDGVDNADPEDELADAADPGCHTDGDASNPASYDPTDDDETDDGALPGAPAPAAAPTPAATERLPETGSDDASTVALAAVMGAAALGALALRRRLG